MFTYAGRYNKSANPTHSSNHGRPLEPATRRRMESHFRQDLRDIRVHTDPAAAQSAQQHNARAYAQGQDIVFNQNQYQPGTVEGNLVLAHELAHCIQQSRAAATSEHNATALEQEADRAASNLLTGQPCSISSPLSTPAIQCLRVSPGGFGQALEEYTEMRNVADRAIRLLRRSPSFRRIAHTLDQQFVARTASADFYPELNDAGRIVSGEPGMPGSMVGKRELMVISGPPAFLPFGTTANNLSSDLIQLNQTDVNGFIQQIAHEATHAANFAAGAHAQAQTIAVEVSEGIQEEIDTRQSEARILREIPNREIQQLAGQVGSQVPADVERDIAPAAGMTYLESFFFSRRLRDAKTSDGIDEAQAAEYRQVISQAVRLGLGVPDYFGEYGEVWRDHELVRKDWVAFLRTNQPGSAGFVAAREVVVQRHATEYFNGLVRYRPLPAASGTP